MKREPTDSLNPLFFVEKNKNLFHRNNPAGELGSRVSTKAYTASVPERQSLYKAR